MSTCAYQHGIMIQIFLVGVIPLVNLEITQKNSCKHNSSTTDQNLMKLGRNEGHFMWQCISTGSYNLIFFVGVLISEISQNKCMKQLVCTYVH